MDRKMSEQKMNIEFVKEVEKHPCIYDYRRMDYARKDETDKAWAAVGGKFDLSGPQCRERWKNLRTVLSRNLRPNGTTRASKQRKPYYLSEAMKFAIPFIKTQNTVPSYFRNAHGDQETEDLSEPPELNEEDVNESIFHIKVESDAYFPSRTPSPQYSSPPPSPEIDLIEPPSPEPVPNPPAKPTPQAGTKRPRETMENDTVETDENLEYQKIKKPRKKITNNKNMTTIKKMTENLDLTKISKKRFLLSLLSDVYGMDDVQMRSFRIKVLHLIDEVSQLSRTGNNAVRSSGSVCHCILAPSNSNIESSSVSQTPSTNQNSLQKIRLVLPKDEKPQNSNLYDKYDS